MMHLIIDDPCQFQGSFVFHRHEFDHLSISFFVVGRLFHNVLSKRVVFHVCELLLHRLSQSVNVRLPIHYQLHEVGRIFAIVEVEQHLSQIWIGQRFFVASGEHAVGMVRLGKVLAQLIFPPTIVLQIFGML